MFQRLPIPNKSLLALLGVTSLIITAAIVLILYFLLRSWFGLPPNAFGAAEGPTQPIAFSHQVHAGTLGIDCTFCHREVTSGSFASVPPVALCMTCHAVVGQGLPEVEKLKNYYNTQTPIDWLRVNRLPDDVRFIHSAHVEYFAQKLNIPASQVCAMCHGDVAGMSKVSQTNPLKMGQCVECHRQNGAPTDCTTCHY